MWRLPRKTEHSSSIQRNARVHRLFRRPASASLVCPVDDTCVIDNAFPRYQPCGRSGMNITFTPAAENSSAAFSRFDGGTGPWPEPACSPGGLLRHVASSASSLLGRRRAGLHLMAI